MRPAVTAVIQRICSGTSVPGPAHLPDHRALLDGVAPHRGAVHRRAPPTGSAWMATVTTGQASRDGAHPEDALLLTLRLGIANDVHVSRSFTRWAGVGVVVHRARSGPEAHAHGGLQADQVPVEVVHGVQVGLIGRGGRGLGVQQLEEARRRPAHTGAAACWSCSSARLRPRSSICTSLVGGGQVVVRLGDRPCGGGAPRRAGSCLRRRRRCSASENCRWRLKPGEDGQRHLQRQRSGSLVKSKGKTRLDASAFCPISSL